MPTNAVWYGYPAALRKLPGPWLNLIVLFRVTTFIK